MDKAINKVGGIILKENLLSDSELHICNELLIHNSSYSNIIIAVNEWRDIAIKIKHGYRLGIEDYENDISIRDILERILTMVSTVVKDKLMSKISDIDKMFYDSTTKISKPLIEGETSEWWYRIPKILKEELKMDLIECGIIGIS